jgi:hypothetical protein
MMYGLLLDIIIGFHFLWILFILFGLLTVWFKPKLAYLHAAGLVSSLVLNLMGWYCPLTYAEKYLKVSLQSGHTYGGSFFGHYLIPFIYPDLPESYIRLGGMVFVCVHLCVYGILVMKYGFFGGARHKSFSSARVGGKGKRGSGHSSY